VLLRKTNEVINRYMLAVIKNPTVHILNHLVVDGNGLYDDGERKAMLNVLQKISPEINAKNDVMMKLFLWY
jgi:hypothetical protein